MKITNAMPRKVCASLMIVGFMTTGCATVRIEEYGRRAMNEQRYRAGNRHLQIAATPILGEADLTKYFGANLIEGAFCPSLFA